MKSPTVEEAVPAFTAKQMKWVALACITIVTIITLSGCGQVDRLEAATTGYSKVCVDGVSYIQFTSGASVQYAPDGTIVKCPK